mgnify:CR=1 FL=1
MQAKVALFFYFDKYLFLKSQSPNSETIKLLPLPFCLSGYIRYYPMYKNFSA